MIYNELKMHGSSNFPIQLYTLTKSEPRYEMTHHYHKNIELIRVLSGTLHIFLDNREYVLNQDEYIFINSETVHAATPENDCVYQCIVYDIDFFSPIQDQCHEFTQKLSCRECFVTEYHPAKKQTTQAFFNLFSSMENVGKSCTKFQVISSLYALYDAIITNGCIEKTSDNPKNASVRSIIKLKNVLSYIRENYREPISLSDMSKVCDMSPKYFCSFFKRMTKKSPVEYLNSYRIEKACGMLIKTDQSVTDIAYSCGFGDLSYFIKTFKKHTGKSPGKYTR